MTYEVFFNLDEAPFSLTPDPEYYFPSKRHNEALETLIYCVESGEGFAQITGQPGVGKTLLIRSFLDQLDDNVNTALILHPGLEPEELFKAILEDLGMAPDNMRGMSKESLLRSFQNILLKSTNQGLQTLVIIDEAQEIPENTLEELRLLSNLETNKAKLLQIILVGQLELEDKLNQQKFKQLHQRITIRYRLETLTLDETVNYIHHRLKVAGGGTISRFSPKIIREIHAISDGIPRIINTLCERSLMAAFVDGKSSVSRDHLRNGALSLGYKTSGTSSRMKKTGLLLVLFLVLSLAGIAIYSSNIPFQKLVDLKSEQLVSFLQTQKTNFLSPSTDQTFEIAAPIKSIQQTDPSEQTVPAGSDNVRKIPESSTIADNKEMDVDSRQQKSTDTGEESAEAVQVAVETPGKENTEYEEYEYVEESESSPEMPVPTVEKYENPVTLPAGWKSITILQKEHKALFFQSNSPVPVKELALPTNTNLEAGLYLLGQAKGTPFLFNHRSFFAWQVNPSLSNWLFQQFTDNEAPPVIPVVILSTDSLYQPDQEELSTIRTMVKNWAAALAQKNIEELMRYYDDSLIGYQLFRDTPTVKSHAQVAAKKARLFKKNEAIYLQTSEPVCIINSEDPTQATALFNQRFISSSYRDSGIKVLYLRKTAKDTSKKPEWVITGTLWLPSQNEKKKGI